MAPHKVLRDIFLQSLQEINAARLSGAELAEAERIVRPMLDMALREYPDDPVFNRMRGEIELALEYPERAIPYLEKALAAEPDNIDNNYNLGQCYFETGAYERAAPLLEKALVASLPDEFLGFMVAFCAFKSGDRLKAGTRLQGLKSSMPDLMQTYPDEIGEMLIAYAGMDANSAPIP